jgi:dTDP-4-dehydrorhamnose reductase
LAEAILLVARRLHDGDRTGLGETYHLAGSGVASWYELAIAVQEECGRLGAKAAVVRPITSAEWPTTARRPLNSALDGGKFTRTFEWAMPDWRTSLRPVVERILGEP